MTDPTPAPTPSPSRWTPEVVIGLLCLVASAVLPHLDLAGVGTALALVSAWLLGPLPSPLTQRPPGAPPDRGHARAEIVVGLVAVGLALAGALALAALSGGCALLERRETRCTTPPELVLEDLADGTCAARAYCDGHEVQTAIGPGPCGEVEER